MAATLQTLIAESCWSRTQTHAGNLRLRKSRRDLTDGRQGSLSVCLYQPGKQAGRAVEPTPVAPASPSFPPPFPPSFHPLFIPRPSPAGPAESYATGENTRLAFLSRTREDIMHPYWLPPNPYSVLTRHPIRRPLAGPKSRVSLPYPRASSATYVPLVRHPL